MSERSDLKQILAILGSIQSDVTDLKLGQKTIQTEQERIRGELRTMKEGYSHHFDCISEQLIGVVRDFEVFAERMHDSFEKWSEQAVSKAIDGVLAIHGPRITALENPNPWD